MLRCPTLVLMALALCGATTGTSAGPLDGPACTKLFTEAQALDAAGVAAILAKGPAASKGTLTREQRDQVRAYLDLVGQLRFRCPNDQPLVVLKPEPPEDVAEVAAASAPIEANAPGITLPPGVAAAVVAPIVPVKPAVPKAQPRPAAKAPAKAPSTEPVAQPVPPAPRPKPKPQVEDAFKPSAPAKPTP
jgi:hypothetical protein